MRISNRPNFGLLVGDDSSVSVTGLRDTQTEEQISSARRHVAPTHTHTRGVGGGGGAIVSNPDLASCSTLHFCVTAGPAV